MVKRKINPPAGKLICRCSKTGKFEYIDKDYKFFFEVTLKNGNAKEAGSIPDGTDRSSSGPEIQTAAVSSLQDADAPSVVAECLS